MRAFLLLLTTLSTTFYYSSIAGQQKRSPLRETVGQVVSVDSRPTRATDWQEVAELKLVARKNTFHVGEMINVDIAMMNQSSEEIFFRSINSPSFVATDEAGKSIAVVPYVVTEFTYTTDLFKLVRASDTTASSDTFAKSWRGITPLHSTAEDVRRLFPTCEEKETGCYIALGDQDVVIIYSGGVNIGPPECKDVPKGTVLAIVVRFRGFKKGRLQTQGRALYHI